MLIFDFDGVLIDSLDEVTVSAYNAVANELITALEKLPQELENLIGIEQRCTDHSRRAKNVRPGQRHIDGPGTSHGDTHQVSRFPPG